MGARFGRRLEGHPNGPAPPVRAGPRAPVKPTSLILDEPEGFSVQPLVDTGTEMVTNDNAAKFK
jgi:hypothetical protein